jgi:peroxiredoxin
MPTFLVDSKIFIRRITLIIEKKIIKKVFYPINDIHKHIEEVLRWLKEN